MKTIVKKEDIFIHLEKLRKMNIKAYVLQWAINEDEDFVLEYLSNGKLDKKGFKVQVESFGFRSKREKNELVENSISNEDFFEWVRIKR